MILIFLKYLFYIYIYIYIYIYYIVRERGCFRNTDIFSPAMGIVGIVFANGLEDRGSIPGQVIPKRKNSTCFLV